MRYLHDEEGRKGLPCQLCDGRDAAYHGVLIAREMVRFLKTEGGSISEDRLVKDLMLV